MQPDSKRSTDLKPPTSEAAPEPGNPNGTGASDVHPVVQRGQEAFRREVLELLGNHSRDWVAYHGDRRLGFSRLKITLLLKGMLQGIPRREMFIIRVDTTDLCPCYDGIDFSDVVTEEELARQPRIPSQLPEILPTTQQALDAHRRDLPQLMKTHFRQWVAYQGGRRLGFGRSKRQLIQKYLNEGIPDEELLVLCVDYMLPDECD